MYNTVEVNHVPITWQLRTHESSLFIKHERISSHTIRGSSTLHTLCIVKCYIFTVSRSKLNGFENTLE